MASYDTGKQGVPMRTSIATVSISGEFPEKLAAIAKAGFTGVEEASRSITSPRPTRS